MTVYPVALDHRRWRFLKVSPTIANLYRGQYGVAITCASCLNGSVYRSPGLPTYFGQVWHLTLLEIERKCRCEHCGSRDARVYPWPGPGPGALGLEGPPRKGVGQADRGEKVNLSLTKPRLL